ncbi:hypothetical protein OHA77_34305 [Streptosporangium sp. NBC_01639]|uniref:hypothetical protein n=1 Tax=Streptosporangium sp. NBC_01639 TaxID=2975948 RepID=UPI003866AA78|nr:hypothetical protein OHA77_34305 [Streptosporangium sp. NBC_01639]
MNDLEERLRAALDARADTYTAAPDAWLGVRRRTRGRRLRRWVTLVPVAAAVAAVAWLATGLPGGDGSDTTVASVSNPDLSFERALRENPAVGEVLLIPHPEFPDVPIRAWYSRRGETEPLTFCRAQQTTRSGNVTTGCMAAEPMDGEEAGRIGGGTGTVPLPAEVTVFGPAKDSVRSVKATLRDGRSFPGTVIRAQGMPAPVWVVRFPGDLSNPPAVTYAFADERGRTLQRLDDVIRPACHTDRTPSGAGVPLPGGITAHLHAHNCLVFWHDGRKAGLSGGDPRTPLGAGLERTKTPIPFWTGVGNLWYGYTGTGTARVELRLHGGERVSADTIGAFPGQGIRLFGGELPAGADPYKDGAVYIGFDAAGDELWRHEMPSREARGARATPAAQTPSRR